MSRCPEFARPALAALALFAMAAASTAQEAQTTPDEQTIEEAYIYLLGRALVIRQEHMDSGAPGFAYNKISYNPIGSTDWVNPNLDTAYLEAWFAVGDGTSVIFEVPEIKGRYYTAQILDEWGEVIANINERMFPSKPFGKLALVYPNSTVEIPADAARIDAYRLLDQALEAVSDTAPQRQAVENIYLMTALQFRDFNTFSTKRSASRPAGQTVRCWPIGFHGCIRGHTGRRSGRRLANSGKPRQEGRSPRSALFLGKTPQARSLAETGGGGRARDCEVRRVRARHVGSGP